MRPKQSTKIRNRSTNPIHLRGFDRATVGSLLQMTRQRSTVTARRGFFFALTPHLLLRARAALCKAVETEAKDSNGYARSAETCPHRFAADSDC